MILLQANSDGAAGLLIFQMILRLVGIMVCVNKANKLTRSEVGWGFFAFMMPVVAMIWIYCLKPHVEWEKHAGN